MSATLFTVFGAGGFIGSRLSMRLKQAGHKLFAPGRDVFQQHSAWLDSVYLGHAIYCIGRTADFRRRPIDTVEAHTKPLAEIVRRAAFESLLFLSSTRVYAGLPGPVKESEHVRIDVNDPDQLYNASKIAGESLCLSAGWPNMRVARLSNVYGPGMGGRGADVETFLAAILRAAATEDVTMRTSPESCKDYVGLDAACDALCAIASEGRERLYNVASGFVADNSAIAEIVARETGRSVRFAPDAPTIRHPEISVERLRSEFGDRLPGLFVPLADRLPGTIRDFLDSAAREAK